MNWWWHVEDSLRFLVSPRYALQEVAVFVLCAARIMYLFGRGRSKRYWKGSALIADVLSVVGLVGLSAMAGRMLLDEDLRALREAEMRAGTALQIEQTSVLGGLCNPIEGNKRPTRAVAEALDLCAAVRSLGGIYRPEINWQEQRVVFSSLATGKRADDALAAEAGKLLSLIDTFVDAKNKVPQAEWDNAELPRLTSSTLVLACLMLAVLGLALKVARSAWEFNEERPREKRG